MPQQNFVKSPCFCVSFTNSWIKYPGKNFIFHSIFMLCCFQYICTIQLSGTLIHFTENIISLLIKINGIASGAVQFLRCFAVLDEWRHVKRKKTVILFYYYLNSDFECKNVWSFEVFVALLFGYNSLAWINKRDAESEINLHKI